MSLWTPGGEVPVERNRPSRPEPETAGSGRLSNADLAAAAAAAGIDLDQLSPEERARAEDFIAEMAEAQQRVAETPAEVVIANHAMGLYELAAIKLSTSPPLLDDARLAIDALGAVVDTLGDRLGEVRPTLQEALDSLRAAWVQLNGEAPTG